MRLFELFEPEFKDTKKTVNYDRRTLAKKGYDSPPSDNELGRGLYSVVKHDPSDNHMVVKSEKGAYASEFMDRNAYYAWVKTIAPYMKSNPYLPRVYVVDDRTDARGSKNPRYKMEKLYSPTELSMDALLGMAEKMQGDGAVDEDAALNVYNTYYHGEFETEEIAFEKFKLWFWKEHVVNLDFLHQARKHDDNLQQAFDLVKSLVSTSDHFTTDMHSGNFMVRLTPYGPQLVFTDPIA